jgi:hypothetical protein
MSAQLSPFRDVGLQHLLENGRNLMRQRPISADRRKQIVDGLVDVFSEADRGAAPLRSQAALWSSTETPSFERFSIFFRYLKDPLKDTVLSDLSEAKRALEAMKAGQEPNSETSNWLAHMFDLLLAGLRRDQLSEPLQPPVEIKFS